MRYFYKNALQTIPYMPRVVIIYNGSQNQLIFIVVLIKQPGENLSIAPNVG